MLCLSLFLLTPVAVLLLKGVGWTLVVVGVLLAALGAWTWWKRRYRRFRELRQPATHSGERA